MHYVDENSIAEIKKLKNQLDVLNQNSLRLKQENFKLKLDNFKLKMDNEKLQKLLYDKY